ncbi:hypothetical protein niasHT_004811 [Heterodera trifolii]|uniref:Uncharacterized protein n=1 Tax=Heterodera trifolii TaxID=157864 RepID=A0ABD2M9M1_9BILA
MHLNPIDIGNVDKLNIAQKLERRRRSVQLVLVTPAEDNKNDHLKLPAPRRQSLGAKCRGGSLRLKMPGVPCPPLAIFPSSAPFLPLIVPKSLPSFCATSPVHLSSPSARADDTCDCGRLLRRRSALSFALPQLPPLFLSKMESKKRNTKGEAEGEESASGVTSMVSSCNSRRELVPQSPLIKVKANEPPQPIGYQQIPTEEVISDEEGTVANSFCAFARAQQKLAEHRAQLDRKLDVVSCHRMAVEMIDELLDSLEQKCHSPQSDEEKGAAKEGKSELTIAEVQKDFFPFIYAKAEQLLVDRRIMANSFTRKLSDKK